MGYTTTIMDTTTMGHGSDGMTMMGYTTTMRPDDATTGYDTNGRGYDPAKVGMTRRRRVGPSDGG